MLNFSFSSLSLKRLFLFLTCLIGIISGMGAQESTYKEILYLANQLMDCRSEEAMQKTVSFFKLTPEGEKDGYFTYSNGKGTSIRFCMESTADNKKNPVVEVKTIRPKKEIDQALKALGFAQDKDKKGFTKGQTVGSAQLYCRIKNTLKDRTLTYSRTKTY